MGDVLYTFLLVDSKGHQAEARWLGYRCDLQKHPRTCCPFPLGQESLFHRSIMDLGFCNVILVKEENTR